MVVVPRWSIDWKLKGLETRTHDHTHDWRSPYLTNWTTEAGWLGNRPFKFFLQNLELCMAGRLKQRYYWLSYIFGNCGPGGATPAAIVVFTVCSAALCGQLHVALPDLREGQWYAFCMSAFLIVILVGCKYIPLLPWFSIFARGCLSSGNSSTFPWFSEISRAIVRIPLIPGTNSWTFGEQESSTGIDSIKEGVFFPACTQMLDPLTEVFLRYKK